MIFMVYKYENVNEKMRKQKICVENDPILKPTFEMFYFHDKNTSSDAL